MVNRRFRAASGKRQRSAVEKNVSGGGGRGLGGGGEVRSRKKILSRGPATRNIGSPCAKLGTGI